MPSFVGFGEVDWSIFGSVGDDFLDLGLVDVRDWLMDDILWEQVVVRCTVL